MKNEYYFLLILSVITKASIAQSNDSIYIHLPEYGVNEVYNTLFDTDRTYYGLYQKQSYSNYCELVELKGKDTTLTYNTGQVIDYKQLDKVEDPIFIICKDEIVPIEQLEGRRLNDRMIYPGDEIQFVLDNKYIIYANGKPVTDQRKDQNAYSSIENYEIILRKIDNEKVTEQTLFISEKVIKGDLPSISPGVYFKWIGDLNQDGKIDILLTIIRHHECVEAVFLLSSPDNGEDIVKEVYRETYCS